MSHARVAAACALALYAALSIIYFGLPLIAHPGQRYLGYGSDPMIEMWLLAWWPHAVAHHLQPFITQAVWPPSGYNLAWTTGMPGPALCMLPVTRMLGPVVTYNILFLSSPVLAAWFAYRLCHHVCGRFWPSLLGGYLFGFSQYVLNQMQGHLHMLYVFPIPLTVEVVLRRYAGRLSRAAFLAALTALLTFNFLCSVEMFATTIAFGTLALVVYALVYRRAVRRLILEILGAAATTTLLLCPYLYYMVLGAPSYLTSTLDFQNDLLSFLLPTRLFCLSGLTPLESSFSNEASAYLGPVFLGMVVWYVGASWTTRRGQFLLATLVLFATLSLGSELRVGGQPVCAAPGWLLTRLPLLKLALPGRFGAYFFLVAAVVIALFLCESSLAAAYKVALCTLGLVFLLPDVSYFLRNVHDVNTPPFFADGRYQAHLARDDSVLVLPYVSKEEGLLWQVRTDYYFRLAAARFTLPPTEFDGWPVLEALSFEDGLLEFPRQLEAFLGANHVKAVIIDANDAVTKRRYMSKLSWSGERIGGVLFYKVPEAVLTTFAHATARDMAREEMAVSFATLLLTGDAYLTRGYPLERLSPAEAERQNVVALPRTHDLGPNPYPRWWRNLWLGPFSKTAVGVGIVGRRDDLQGLAEVYREYASDVSIRPTAWPGLSQLMMAFERTGLERASIRAQRVFQKNFRPSE